MRQEEWTQCPQCAQKANDELEERYGKVSMNEFKEALSRYHKEITRGSNTLLETIHTTFEGGNALKLFFIAKCDKCGFKEERNI